MPARTRAGVIGRVELRKKLLGFSKGALAKKKQGTVDAALVAGIIAKNVGQNTIATTPSSLSREPKGNRIWTGAMFEGYDADVKQTGTKITVRWGWINSKRKYFKTQEYGGFAFGKNVTPMHALANSGVAAQDYLHSKGIK